MSTTVLAVDSSALVRKQVARSLEPDGYTVLGAANGVEAIQRLAEFPHIRLVVTDVLMPLMDGFELLDHVQKVRPGLEAIVLSNEPLSGVIERSRHLGAAAWVQKPVAARKLLALVRHVVGPPWLSTCA